MHTACSLTISRHIPHTPATMHAPDPATMHHHLQPCTPLQPHMSPHNHAPPPAATCPTQPYMPPTTIHAPHTPATMHAPHPTTMYHPLQPCTPLQPHMSPNNHAPPPAATRPTQPHMPPTTMHAPTPPCNHACPPTTMPPPYG